jgi:hypothetical protein
MRKIAGLASASLAALTLFVACSSHDKPTSAPTDAGDGGFPYVNEAVLASNAHAVMTEPTTVAINVPDAGGPVDAGSPPDAGDAGSVDAAGNPVDATDLLDAPDPGPPGMTVTFPANSETESFKVGDVIASGKVIQNYYLGSITSISKSGGQITFVLAPASLTDLFQSVHFSQFLPASDAMTDSFGLHTLGTSGSSGSESPGGKASFSASGSSLNFSQSRVSVNGGIEFSCDYSIFSGLNTLFLAAKGNLAATLVAQLTLSGGVQYTSPEAEWADVQLGIFTFFIGPVPVPVAWEIDFTAQATATATSQYTFGTSVTANVSIEEGVKYQDGQVTPVDNKQFTYSHGPITHEGFGSTFDVTAYPLSAKMYLKPFKFVGGPFVKLAPFAEITVSDNSQNGAKAVGYVGAAVGAGGTLKIFNKTLGEKSFTLPIAKFQVFDESYQSACSPNSSLSNAWCKESALQSCVGTKSGATNLPSCVNKSGVCSNQGPMSGPSDLDTICNAKTLASCLCAQQMGGKDAGNCYSQHCAPCSQAALSCSAPN